MPIKVNFQYCDDEDGTIVFVSVGKEKELLKVPFYLSKDAEQQLPQLREGINQLPKLLEMIYNSGKNNEEIQFSTENIVL